MTILNRTEPSQAQLDRLELQTATESQQLPAISNPLHENPPHDVFLQSPQNSNDPALNSVSKQREAGVAFKRRSVHLTKIIDTNFQANSKQREALQAVLRAATQNKFKVGSRTTPSTQNVSPRENKLLVAEPEAPQQSKPPSRSRFPVVVPSAPDVSQKEEQKVARVEASAPISL